MTSNALVDSHSKTSMRTKQLMFIIISIVIIIISIAFLFIIFYNTKNNTNRHNPKGNKISNASSPTVPTTKFKPIKNEQDINNDRSQHEEDADPEPSIIKDSTEISEKLIFGNKETRNSTLTDESGTNSTKSCNSLNTNEKNNLKEQTFNKRQTKPTEKRINIPLICPKKSLKSVLKAKTDKIFTLNDKLINKLTINNINEIYEQGEQLRFGSLINNLLVQIFDQFKNSIFYYIIDKIPINDKKRIETIFRSLNYKFPKNEDYIIDNFLQTSVKIEQNNETKTINIISPNSLDPLTERFELQTSYNEISKNIEELNNKILEEEQKINKNYTNSFSLLDTLKEKIFEKLNNDKGTQIYEIKSLIKDILEKVEKFKIYKENNPNATVSVLNKLITHIQKYEELFTTLNNKGIILHSYPEIEKYETKQLSNNSIVQPSSNDTKLAKTEYEVLQESIENERKIKLFKQKIEALNETKIQIDKVENINKTNINIELLNFLLSYIHIIKNEEFDPSADDLNLIRECCGINEGILEIIKEIKEQENELNKQKEVLQNNENDIIELVKVILTEIVSKEDNWVFYLMNQYKNALINAVLEVFDNQE